MNTIEYECLNAILYLPYSVKLYTYLHAHLGDKLFSFLVIEVRQPLHDSLESRGFDWLEFNRLEGRL